MKTRRITVVTFSVFTPRLRERHYAARSEDVVDLVNMGLWGAMIQQSRAADAIWGLG